MAAENDFPEEKPYEKKKGLLRLFELIDRDGTKFLKAGFLAFLGAVPFIAVLCAAVVTRSVIFLLGCIPAGMLAAPEMFGMADTLMRSMRDEVGWWWWESYRDSWKRDLKASLLPGAVFGFVIGLQIFCLYLIADAEDPVREFWMLAAASWVGMGIFGYLLPMGVCVELPFPSLLRNCFALFFMHPVRSLLASALQLIYFILILTWFPLTSVVLPLFSVWLPMLPALMILYPVLDMHLDLSNTYEKLRAARWGGSTEESEDSENAASD